MNKYNNPRLLNAVVSGTGMKHPIQPHVVVGDVSNGFIRGDLMDANAIVDLVNSGDAIDQETIRQAVADIIGTAPENLDTLGEIVEALDAAVLDPNTEGSLANQISVINTTIEDNELTIAAALNDLNSRILELVTRVDALDGGGDTPTPNTFKYEFSPGGWIAGEIVDNGGEFKEALIYAQQENVARVYHADGVASGGMSINDTIKQNVADAIQETLHFQVEPVGQMEEPTAQGETVPNWDSYQIVEK